ncbi:MAG: hypothetical protein K0Q49_2412 [Haloplasmataceae bacterium]|jgi:DNA repair exonuclease SbcCD ATPase subunit|nr:hypothetical protein [Haloplasmataceae bacterium]
MELDQPIMDLKLIIGEKGKIERKLNDATDEYNTLSKQENELKEILVKEEKDVLRLEKVSLSSIWFGFFGSKTEKLWKEKEEFSKAEYDYKVVYNTLDNLKSEINEIKKSLNNIKNKESELEHLLNQKENIILDSNLELSEKIKEINNKINNYRSQKKEISEAISAGNTLINSLKEVLNSLNKAKNWGTYDMFGGGFLADMAKHSHLNNAKSSIDNLKYQASRFNRELKDVNLTLDLNVDISSTLKFADWFFDGFFVDYAVQSKINNSINQVQNQMNYVFDIINKLNNRLKDSDYNIELLTKEKKGLL